MSLGSRIQELIDANNTNVNELAQNIDVAPTTLYSMIKRDSKKADIEVLIRIANYFKVSIDELLNENKEEYKEPTVVAAHATEDLTEEEIDEVMDFIEYVKSKRNK